MYVVAAIGLLTIALSAIMIASPERWSRGILAYSRQRHFHLFEVVSRLLLGAALVSFANEALHPRLIAGFGYVLLAAGAGLALIDAKRHRAFAVKSASFTGFFRPAGVVSLGFGAFIVHSALGPAAGTG